MIKVSAPGNAFFFGEHSVVYQIPALVAAVGMRTYTEVGPSDGDLIVFRSESYGEVREALKDILARKFETHEDYKAGDVLEPVRDVIKTYAERFGLDKGMSFNVHSDIPRESGGMSSSTAFLCSMLYAMAQHNGQEIPKEEFFDILYPLQVRIHGGAASGSEITSSSMGGYNWVRIDKSGEKPRLERRNLGEHPYKLVIGNTGIEAQTREAVQKVRTAWEENKGEYEEYFNRIGEIVGEGEKALMAGKIEIVGELMNENHKILSESLGVSHPLLEKLVNASREAGAYGAKLSGGGMGGIMIALVDEETQQKVAEAIRSTGGTPYTTSVGVEGVRVE